MTFKKFLIFICLIMVLFTVAGVSASDVNDTVTASENQNDEMILTENQDDNALSANEENRLSASTGTFTDLAKEIKNSKGELNLTHDYAYSKPIGYGETDEKYIDGIPVNKVITINGNGHAIDGKNNASAFFILNTTNQIVLNNITFKNCYSATIGGAVYSAATNIVITNCRFIDNSAKDFGAALYMFGEHSTISNCTFTNNKAKNGGAIFIKNGSILSNCIFTNNKADDGGAAIIEKESIILNCSFINNTANKGGAVWTQEPNCAIMNCRFTNNVAKEDGGAVYSVNTCINLLISNSTFTNNYANYGGSIWTQGVNSTAKNCNFISNNAAKDGGAIYVDLYCINVIISNSTFTNNKATDGGALLIFSPTTLSDSIFTNNTANCAGAIWMQTVNSTIMNCIFENNTASTRAGAVIITDSKNCNVKNSNFTGNIAKTGGGAIAWDYDNNGNVENTHFTNNAAKEGSAMYGGTAINCSFENNNVYNTTVQFSVKDTITYIADTVMFYGLPECNLTVTASDKNGDAKTFECTNKGWNVGNLKTGDYTVKFTIKKYDDNSGELTAQITVRDRQIQDLNELIQSSKNDAIILNYDYICYDAGNLANGIIINKSVTIDGQGHKIDASNLMRIFQVTDNAEVTFKNIIFKNGQAKYGGFGAAIWNNGAKSVTAINCTFENNQASYGGAIANVNAITCSFTNNKASGFGGAMWGGSAIDSSFISNSAKYGGAMQKSYAQNCTFIKNSASDLGGAMNGGSAVNSSFINNTASTGSAIYTGSADNCTFAGNTAYHTEIKFYIIKEDIMFKGDTVSFQGLPECNIKITATKDGITKELTCTNAGWKIENIELGIYDVEFSIDDSYNNGKVNTAMQLGYALDLSLNLMDIFIGQDETVEIYVSNIRFTDDVTLSVNGNNYTVKIVNGYGKQSVCDLPIGEYSVAASIKSDKFWPAKASAKFEVTPKFDLDLTVNVEDIIENQNEIVKINTIDIFTGNLTISINGYNNTVEIINGTGNYTYPEMPTGNYTVTVSFEGNTAFNAATKTVKFEVLPKQNLNLTVNVEDIEEGNVANIYVSANELFDGEVKISINGTEIQNETLEITDGEATFQAMDLAAGNYTVTVSFDGNSAFNPDSKSVKFEVKVEKEKIDLNLTVSVEDIFVGDNATVKVTTNSTFSGKVILIINGIVNDNITITNGEGSYTLKNLAAGNYTAYVAFNGDDTFKADAKAKLFEVEKRALNLTASAEDIFVGQNATVKVTTDKRFKGNLSIAITGIVTDIITAANGEGSYTLKNLPAGDYTIYISFKEDNEFKADSCEIPLTVKKYDLYLNASSEDIFEGQGATVNITANTTFTGNVTVSVNNLNYTVNVADGVGSFIAYNLAEGNYTVTVSFNGDERFNGNETSTTFKVKPKYNLNLNVDVQDIFEGQSETVEIHTIYIFKGNVTVLLDDNTYTVNVADGYGSYIASGLGIGNHTVTVVCDGNYMFNPDEKSVQLEVTPKFDLDLTVNVEDIIENQNEIVKINTIDIFTGNLTISINGYNNTVEIINGTGNYTYPEMERGNYTVTVSFNGNTAFNPGSKTAKFEVHPKENLNLTVNVNDIEEGDMAIIYISANPLFDGDVMLSINGTDIQNEILDITDGKGTYQIMHLIAGNYTVTVSFNGNDAFNPDSNPTTFEVKEEKEKFNLNLTVSVEDIFEGQNAIVKVKTSNTFTGTVFAFIKSVVNGTISIVNGTGSYSIAKLKENSYSAYVGFNGDDTFRADVSVALFEVKPAVYKIINNKDVAMLYTAKSPYKVRVTKNGNSVGAGEVVAIKFNGKTYKVKTDKKGYATLKLPNAKPKKAKYTITVTYKGVTVKNKVKVKSIIKASNKKVKKSKKLTKIKITLKKVNKKYLKNKKIKIKFKGKTYKVKTNKKGVATWKVKKSMLKKLKVGKKYKYKVTYGKDTVTKKLTIKR